MIWVLVYIVAVFFTTGASLAHLQHDAIVSYGGKAVAKEEYRSDLAFSIGWSLFPPCWIVAIFSTGFYEHGFQWKRLK